MRQLLLSKLITAVSLRCHFYTIEFWDRCQNHFWKKNRLPPFSVSSSSYHWANKQKYLIRLGSAVSFTAYLYFCALSLLWCAYSVLQRNVQQNILQNITARFCIYSIYLWFFHSFLEITEPNFSENDIPLCLMVFTVGFPTSLDKNLLHFWFWQISMSYFVLPRFFELTTWQTLLAVMFLLPFPWLF